MKKKKGFNCAVQVLVEANATLKILDFDSTYLKIASGFGGGVSRKGSICGAISGGIMALGLKFGTDGTENRVIFSKKRQQLRDLALYFMLRFEDVFGSIECRSLLGLEMWTDEGWKQ